MSLLNYKSSIFQLVILLVFVTSSWAVENSEQQLQKQQAKQALVQLKDDIKSLQQKLNSKQKQQNKAITKLKRAEKQIATATKILRSTNRQLRKKNKQLNKLRKQQNNLEKNKTKQKKALAAQIKAAFINGKQGYLKMLLNQEDPDALGRMLTYYDYMNKARTEKVARLQKTLIELKNIDQNIQREIQKLNVLKKSKQAETKRLQKLKTKRKQLVDALAKEIDAKTEKLTELQINASELQNLIDSVRETIDNIEFSQPLDGLASFKGKLNWPTKGKMNQIFGTKLAEGLNSNGVIIKAAEGKSVNAVHYGRIVYADWLRGFGLLMILDHGEGYMSLYGYNQALYKDRKSVV